MRIDCLCIRSLTSVGVRPFVPSDQSHLMQLFLVNDSMAGPRQTRTIDVSPSDPVRILHMHAFLKWGFPEEAWSATHMGKSLQNFQMTLKESGVERESSVWMRRWHQWAPNPCFGAMK